MLVATVLVGLLWHAAPTAATTAAKLSVMVQGNLFVDSAGNPLVIHGVNRSGTEYACSQGWGMFDGPSDAPSVAAIAAWHTNAVRVPLNEDCWLGINGVVPAYAGANYRSAVAAYVTTLHRAGLIAILDLHWNAPGSTLANGQQVMADADHSPAFWSSVATAFRADPAVVFDLYNEPHDISWSCWRDGCVTSGGWQTAGMQSLVNAVRATGATQPVMLGGLGWSSDLSSWLTYRPVDPAGQEAASFHVYNFSGCNTASCWSAQVGPVAAGFPVVTGEIGENDCASGFIAGYMAWADAHGVSYLGWTWDTWDCSSGPALITAYDGTPTSFGVGFRDHLAAVSSGPAGLNYPTDGQANVDATRAFTWVSTPASQSYLLAVGTAPFGTDLVLSSLLPPGTTSYKVPSLPRGKTLYATLLTSIGGTWYYTAITFTVSIGPAIFTYPTNGQTNVDTAQAFTWGSAPRDQGYLLAVGTTPFGTDLVLSSLLPAGTTSYRMPSLPSGKTLYATLLTSIGGTWYYTAVTFTVSIGPAIFTYPANGQTNVDTTKAFTWASAPRDQGYLVAVGTTTFGTDLVLSSQLPPGTTSFMVPSLPSGRTLHATLLTSIGGTWYYSSITFAT